MKSNTEETGTLLQIKLTPKAAANRLIVDPNGTIKAYVTVPPEDGKANEALIKLLAKHFKLPKSTFTLVQGQTNRQKIVQVNRKLKNYPS